MVFFRIFCNNVAKLALRNTVYNNFGQNRWKCCRFIILNVFCYIHICNKKTCHKIMLYCNPIFAKMGTPNNGKITLF